MQNAEIVIHGASGFIGKHFIRAIIEKNIPVIVLARKSSKLNFDETKYPFITVLRYEKNLSEINGEALNVHHPVFFEFSWNGVFGSERNAAEQLTVNIPLILSSVNLAHQLNAKHWVGFGSQAEYGNLNKKIQETDTCHPTTLYGKSKLLCSQISAELCAAYQMEHSWLRLFSVFGPEDNPQWLIPYLITEMLQNKEINTTLGEQRWDYLYIDDIIQMLFLLKEQSGAGIANLGSGRAIKVKEIIKYLKKATNSSTKINFGAIPYRPDQVMHMEADITQLSTHLGWTPQTDIRTGLSKMIKYYTNKIE